MLRIYKNGSGNDLSLVILTDSLREHRFRKQVAEAADSALRGFEEDATSRLQFLEELVEHSADIICRLRGYKNDVKERRLIMSGNVWPGEDEEPLSISGDSGGENENEDVEAAA